MNTLPLSTARLSGNSFARKHGRQLHGLAGAAVLGFALSASAQFVAYNDSAWRIDQYTYTPTITTYTIDNTAGLPTSGFLKRNDGTFTSVTASFFQSGGAKLETDTVYGGDNCNPGTDAANIFGGIVDLHGTQVYGSTGWYITLTLSGLNPDAQYEFVTTANRNGNYPSRLTKYTLSGADAFANQSSAGATFSGVTDPSTTFCTGGNTVNGYVARWADIHPGQDGTIQIRAEATASSNSAYGFDAFRLTETLAPEPSSLALLLLGGLLLGRRKG